MRADVIHCCSGLDDSRPANEEGHTVATLPVGVLLAAEGGGSTVRPTQYLGPVVAAENDDGVIRDAEVIQLLEQNSDSVIEFLHTRAIEAVFGDHGLVLRLQMGPDVHACRVVPDKERLARLH